MMIDDIVDMMRARISMAGQPLMMPTEMCAIIVNRIEMLESALDQLLDDMGDEGLCVCQAAKDQAIEALGETND